MKITNPDNIGESLKIVRGSVPLREAAKRAGLDFTYLSKIENNREVPSWDMLKKLLNAYGAEPDLRRWAYWQLARTHKEQLKLALAFAKEHEL
jgi:transcriptional regulator with XRE-family HTH domain